jgi:hypothetical protein
VGPQIVPSGAARRRAVGLCKQHSALLPLLLLLQLLLLLLLELKVRN